MEHKRLVILAEGAFSLHAAKTAVGVIRYGQDKVVAVIDSTRAGQDSFTAIGVGHGIPIIQDITAALPFNPTALLIGIAPVGGGLPSEWRWQILTALRAGLEVISGLHVFLAEDPELVSAALQAGTRIWDVRRPPEELPIARELPHRPGSFTVLTVGSDCSVGKMSVALELDRSAQQAGFSSVFAASGQTGIMISGAGLPVDRIISDFVPGAVEQMVVNFAQEYEWVFVEGQGSLVHPAYSAVTLGLLHGARPDALILCHETGRRQLHHFRASLPPLPRLIKIYEEAASWVQPSKVLAVALNTYLLSEEAAQDTITQVEQETGLPADDAVRYGGKKLFAALKHGRNV